MELQTKQPPELEFSMPEVEESLTAYLSAIGGAIIGLLLTLLVLAIWNGGTLNFTNISRVNALEAGLTDVAGDLETVNTNVDALSERLILLEQEAGAVVALQKSLTDLDASLADLDSTLSAQGIRISELDSAVNDLQVTRRNFDLFTAALTDALSQMEASASAAQSDTQAASRQSQPVSSRQNDDRAAASTRSSASTRQAASQPVEQAQPALPYPEPASVLSEDVAPDALLVYLFLDVNADGLFDSDENLIAGATVTLTSPDGRTVAAENDVGSAGTRFEELNAGQYTISVEDVQGYTLASRSSTAVTVDPDAEAGRIVYFAVVTTVAD
ncbi:MAG: hypothetical protein OXK78_07730 [Caldilineaceae bacterium]|nr:hypothetical protein [Caldilineaceae bacterium]